ncbi:L,D-transpeptidase family protein [Saccharomonospora viridis]|uniref:Ykud domain-containing protein n=1 Tax=Saccharomonospora viridis (strain ATCC 15386 / DSM 43017 / JCM 3036 / CCUG 5913 / NBRC 12207 / NCIMB 9602 / P101) TaxID=471857 RepID=C7MQN1_SACVD|nr:L,D-transpeptidase [Saccharomonospora viridis]ACU98558.1 Ykud domain-containing protein [Saccharomonospora viridis DSM 43017]
MLALAAVATLTLLVSACGGDTEKQAEAAEGQSQQQIASLPEATTYGKIPDAPMDPEPNAPTEGEVLHPTRELTVHDAVDGKPIARLPVKQISSPTWVPVIARDGDWAQILLPTRPNGATGWINTSGDAVESAENDYLVNVDLDSFHLEILKNGERIGEWTVGIGKPESPTPTGRAYIIASIKETVNDYSPIVLPLSYHSDSHETYGGGPGTVGIHTWPDNSFVGKANSDGCIRVTKDALEALTQLPLGTIVNIV